MVAAEVSKLSLRRHLVSPRFMEANPSPQSGINAWLEEELLQQYHHDRTSVDADWETIFEHEKPNGNGGSGNGKGVAHPVPPRALAPAVTASAVTISAPEPV